MAKPARKAAAKKAPAKKSAAKKAASKSRSAAPLKTVHYLPPWVVVTKSLDGAIIGLDPQSSTTPSPSSTPTPAGSNSRSRKAAPCTPAAPTATTS